MTNPKITKDEIFLFNPVLKNDLIHPAFNGINQFTTVIYSCEPDLTKLFTAVICAFVLGCHIQPSLIIKRAALSKSSLLLKYTNITTKLSWQSFTKGIKEPSEVAWVWIDRVP